MLTVQSENFTVEEMAHIYGDLTLQRPLTRAEFYDLSARLPDLKMERSSKGITSIISPIKKGCGRRESLLHGQPFIWNHTNAAGDLYGPNGTYELPDGGIKMPDVSWISAEQTSKDTGDDESFIRIVPDFVAEIRSSSDRLPTLLKKMEFCISNGVRLGWLIDPYTEKVFVYRPETAVEIIEGFDGRQLAGAPVLNGFILNLDQMR